MGHDDNAECNQRKKAPETLAHGKWFAHYHSPLELNQRTLKCVYALVVELEYTLALGANAERIEGSSPS